jgi:hypothetical protein
LYIVFNQFIHEIKRSPVTLKALVRGEDMNKTVHKIGFCLGLIAFASTVEYVIVQALQFFGVLSYPLDGI